MTSIALSDAIQSDAASSRTDALPAPRPWREIGRAVLFHVVASLLGVAAGLAYAIAVLIYRSKTGWPDPPARIGRTLLVEAVMQICLIWMTIARGRRLGGGDLALGLAAGPIPRSRLFSGVIIAELAFATLCVALLRGSATFQVHFFYWTDRQLFAAVREGPVLVMAVLVNLAILAPIYEELLFRGWLWTALRRSWGVWPTALATSGAWLALHAPQGWTKVLFLLPLAVILSLLRHRTGSVRATIAVHMLNNARAFLLPLAALWYS